MNINELDNNYVLRTYIEPSYEIIHIFHEQGNDREVHELTIYPGHEAEEMSKSNDIQKDIECSRCGIVSKIHIWRHYGYNNQKITCIDCCILLDKERESE